MSSEYRVPGRVRGHPKMWSQGIPCARPIPFVGTHNRAGRCVGEIALLAVWAVDNGERPAIPPARLQATVALLEYRMWVIERNRTVYRRNIK